MHASHASDERTFAQLNQSTKVLGDYVTRQDEFGIQKDGQNGDHVEHRPADPWTRLAETAWHGMNADMDRWWSERDSLLTFAGLFSAVVTAFAVLAYSILTTEVASPTGPDLLRRYVAALWFAALVCALAAALVAISVGQWLNHLLTPPADGVEVRPRQNLRIWNLRRTAFYRWRMDFLAGIPSVLLQIALTIFVVGLVGFLWTVSVAVAMPTVILVAFILFFQLTAVAAPAVAAYSPFQSPQAIILRWMWLTLGYRICSTVQKVIRRLSGCVRCRMIAYRLQDAAESLEPVIRRLEQLRMHCSWMQNETLYLKDLANSHDVDTTLFAFLFATAVTKDDESTLLYIRQCLNDMPIDLARSNATALIDACDRARLDNDIQDRVNHGDDVNSWSYESLNKHVSIMMGHVVVDVMRRLIHSQLPKRMDPFLALSELDEMCVDMAYVLRLLSAEDIAVYLRLIELLDLPPNNDRDGAQLDPNYARRKILDLVWKQASIIDLSRRDDMTDVMNIIKKSYGQADDYATKLDLIILALHINTHWQSTIDDILVFLNELLRSGSKSQFEGAMHALKSHVYDLFSDLELFALASTSHTESLSNPATTDSEAGSESLRVPDRIRSQPDPDTAHPSEPISGASSAKLDASHGGPTQDAPADIMNEVLRRMLWLVGDREFPSNNRDTDGRRTSSTLTKILYEVNKRLPNAKEEAIECAPENSEEDHESKWIGFAGSADQPPAEPEPSESDGGRTPSQSRRRVGHIPGFPRRSGNLSRPDDEENQSIGAQPSLNYRG